MKFINMKNQIIKKSMLVLSFSFLALTGYSQSRNHDGSAPPQTNIKTNVAGYFIGQYQLAVERAITDHFSLQMSAGYVSRQLSLTDYSNEVGGYILIPEVRFYFSSNAPKGLYASAFGRLRSTNNNLTDKKWTPSGTGIDQDLSREKVVTSVGGGITLGYQIISRGGFTFDFFAGPQYKTRTVKTNYNTSSLDAAAISADFENKGDELFAAKYPTFKFESNPGIGLRFGLNVGFSF